MTTNISRIQVEASQFVPINRGSLVPRSRILVTRDLRDRKGLYHETHCVRDIHRIDTRVGYLALQPLVSPENGKRKRTCMSEDMLSPLAW